MRKRGAYFFVLDALIAGAIFIITIILVLSNQMNKPTTRESLNLAEDTMNFILNTKVNEFNNEYINYLYNQGLVNGENTLFNQISFLHHGGYDEEATQLTKVILDLTLEQQYGVNYSIEGETIYSRSTDKIDRARFLLSSKKISFVTDSLNTIYDPEIVEVQIWN